jgi:hypothetical protein
MKQYSRPFNLPPPRAQQMLILKFLFDKENILPFKILRFMYNGKFQGIYYFILKGTLYST